MYQLHSERPVHEEVEEEDDVSAATHWLLPHGTTLWLMAGIIIIVLYYYPQLSLMDYGRILSMMLI